MRRVVFLFLSVICCLAVNAQERPGADVMQQVEAAHVAWLTNRLALTPDEAQRFWPVYNNYQRELTTIARERKQANANAASDISGDELRFDSRLLDLRKRYQGEFRKAIGNRSAGLFRADREWRELLIRQLKKRRRQ